MLRSLLRSVRSACRGTPFATREGVRKIESIRYDDVVLSVLLLIIGAPRAIAAVAEDRPIGVEGTLSLVCVLFGLAILAHRNLSPRNAAQSS